MGSTLLQPSIDYELASTLLAQGKTYKDVAAQLNVKPGTLRQGLCRRGVTAVSLRAAAYVAPSKENKLLRLAADASKLLRQSLGGTLAKHAAALEQVQAKPDLKHLKDVTEVLEPLARTGKIVHDWGNDEPQTVVQIGLVGGWDSHQDALEVSASVTPQTSTPQEQQQPANIGDSC